MSVDLVNESLEQARQALDDFIAQDAAAFIQLLATAVTGSLDKDLSVIICGNGGSACDAMHFSEEFTGRFRENRRALPVMSLNDPGHMSCVANDFGYEYVFQRGVQAFGKQGAVFIGLSTSGNSESIIQAVDEAKKKGMTTVLLLGKDGGECAGMADLECIVPGKTTDRIQELHMLLLHIVIEAVEQMMFYS